MEIQAVSQVSRSELLTQQTQQASPKDSVSSENTAQFERAMNSGTQNNHHSVNQTQQSQGIQPNREVQEVKYVNQSQVVDSRQVAFINETQAAQCTVDGQQDGCLGDAILDGLDKIRQDSTEQFKTIELALSGDNLNSAQDMLRIQYEMNVWALKQELFAKTAGGFDRSVDTLLKSQ